MKRLVLLSAGLILTACAGTPRTVDETPAANPVGRDIASGDGRVELGQRLPENVIEVDDSTFALPPGTFSGGGTMGVVARVDESHTVQALLFFYDASIGYDARVAMLTESLGEPTRAVSGAGGARLAVWQDARTRFELYQEPGSEAETWSVLRNLDRS